MIDLRDELRLRREEFDTHYALARAVELLNIEGGDPDLQFVPSVRDVLTIKSGLIIHLYNIVEATMDNIIKRFGFAVGQVQPSIWTDEILLESLRCSLPLNGVGDEQSRLGRFHELSKKLLLDEPLGAQNFKKPSGTWSDKVIGQFSRRLRVQINLPEEMWRRIRPNLQYAEKSPMEFLAERRNAIAHGRRLFEQGASDLTLAVIRELADVTMDYMEFVVSAFHDHVEREAFKNEVA